MEHTAKQEGLQVSTELSTVCEGCSGAFWCCCCCTWISFSISVWCARW